MALWCPCRYGGGYDGSRSDDDIGITCCYCRRGWRCGARAGEDLPVHLPGASPPPYRCYSPGPRCTRRRIRPETLCK